MSSYWVSLWGLLRSWLGPSVPRRGARSSFNGKDSLSLAFTFAIFCTDAAAPWGFLDNRPQEEVYSKPLVSSK